MSRETSCFRCEEVVNPDEEPLQRVANYVRGVFETETAIQTVGVFRGWSDRVLEDVLEWTYRETDDETDDVTYQDEFGEETLVKMMFKNDDRLPFEMHPSLFRRDPIGSPEDLKSLEEGIRAESETIEVQREKTAVVCPECTEDDDSIIWGVQSSD